MPELPQSPVPEPPPRKRCLVYVDGFNLYYGVLEANPAWKWLNLQSLFEALRPDEEVVAIKYFTALVEPDRHLSPKRDRQPLPQRWPLARFPRLGDPSEPSLAPKTAEPSGHLLLQLGTRPSCGPRRNLPGASP
jgi:hypothetical protein